MPYVNDYEYELEDLADSLNDLSSDTIDELENISKNTEKIGDILEHYMKVECERRSESYTASECKMSSGLIINNLIR